MRGHLGFPRGRVSSGLGAGDDAFCALLSLGLFLVMDGGMEKVSSGTSTHPPSFPPRHVPTMSPSTRLSLPSWVPSPHISFVPLGDESQVESR